MELERLVKEKPYLVTVALVGALLIGVGVLSAAMIAGRARSSEIEIVRSGEEAFDDAQDKEIFVDVSGAVIKPGLYQLAADARVNDALAAAGGLDEAADREWFAKNINLAQKVEDGAKIFIPTISETSSENLGVGGGAAGETVTGKVNVNTATAAELDLLWGIGPATAEKIIANRPYSSVEELLDKKVLKSNVYETNRDKLTVY
ncbi:TPA: competence protein ComEA [Candidatus Beckwithbacteria bacterium]|nr:competence protein ComEA [Candidatus Beckwithbacteria bacterium]